MKVLLFGYNGHFNFGDDLLLKLAYDVIDKKKVNISISTNNKIGVKYLSDWFPDAKIVLHLSPGRIFYKYNKVIYIGGNLIFNYEENPSLIKVFRKKISMLKIFSYAHFRGTRFGAISLGIGPFHSKLLEETLLRPLKYFDLLLIRDELSLKFTRKYSNSHAIIKKYSDLSVSEFSILKPQRRIVKKVESILIIMRSINVDGVNSGYINTLKEFSIQQNLSGKKITWCSLQKDYDKNIFDFIPKKDEFWQWDPEEMVLEIFYNLVKSVDVVITSRMHGLFVSGMLNIPTIGIRLHSKFDSAASLFGNNVITISPTMSLRDLSYEFKKISESISNQEEFDVPNDISTESLKAIEAYQRLSNWIVQ